MPGCFFLVNRDPAAPVALGDWCSMAASQACEQFESACFGGGRLGNAFLTECGESARKSCQTGRDGDTQSGRTVGQLKNCLAYIDSLSCEALGASIASGEMAHRCGVAVLGR
jgi:hypothetical protein